MEPNTETSRQMLNFLPRPLHCYINDIKPAFCSCCGISNMRMLIFFPSPFFIIFIQFPSCEGIYNVYLLHSSTLSFQVRPIKGVGVVGQPGPEKDPVSRAVVLVTTRRLQTMSVQIMLKVLQPVSPGPPGKSAQIQALHLALRSGQRNAKRPVMKVRMWTSWLSLLVVKVSRR